MKHPRVSWTGSAGGWRWGPERPLSGRLCGQLGGCGTQHTLLRSRGPRRASRAASEPALPVFQIKTARTCPAAGTSPFWPLMSPASGLRHPQLPGLWVSLLCPRFLPAAGPQAARPRWPGPHSCSRLWSCVLGLAQAKWLELGRGRPRPCALRSLRR